MSYNDCRIIFLPRELLRYIGGFFNFQRRNEENVFRLSSHWKNFLNTSKEVLQQLKKETQLLELRGDMARQYFNCPAFREQVNSTITDYTTQLSLTIKALNGNPTNEQDPHEIKSLLFSGEGQKFPGAKSLNISHCLIPSLPPLTNVLGVVLNNCTIQSSTAFGYVKDLNITNVLPFEINLLDLGAHSLTEFSVWSIGALVDLHDYQELRGVRTVRIESCDSVSNVECFQHARNLSLVGCKNITNVSCLGKVVELELTDCIGITDVSGLSTCLSVSLSGCINISEVSCLGSVTHLNLSDCVNVRDVSALGRVRHLYLRGCYGISDISQLGFNYILDLSGCPLITSVSSLGSVYRLSLSEFQGNDISALKNVKELDLSRSPHVSDLTSLSNSVEVLNISHCNLIVNITMLHKVKSLDLVGCFQIKDVSGLKSLQDLEMNPMMTQSLETIEIEKGYETFRQLKALSMGKTKDIDLVLAELQSCRSLGISSSYPSISSLSLVRNLRHLQLSECSLVETLPNNLIYLKSVGIHKCPHFQLIPELPNLKNLSVINCPELRSFTSFGNSDQLPIQSVYFAGCNNLETVFVKRRIIGLTMGTKVIVDSSDLVTNITRFDF
jgi:hypothetical protein